MQEYLFDKPEKFSGRATLEKGGTKRRGIVARAVNDDHRVFHLLTSELNLNADLTTIFRIRGEHLRNLDRIEVYVYTYIQ